MSTTHNFAVNYIQHHPKKSARILESFPPSDIQKFLNLLKKDELSLILSSLSPAIVSAIIVDIPAKKIADFFLSSSNNFSAFLFQSLPKNKKKQVLEFLPEDKVSILKRWMQYLPETAGSHMNASIFPFNQNTTIKKCLQILGEKNSLFYYIYLVDDDGKLVGVTTIKKMLEATKKSFSCKSIMDSPVFFIQVDSNSGEIIGNNYWNKYSTLPVVDYEEKFLGAIPYSIYNKIRKDFSGEHTLDDLNSVGEALSELYSIGFKALTGSMTVPSNLGNKNE